MFNKQKKIFIPIVLAVLCLLTSIKYSPESLRLWPIRVMAGFSNSLQLGFTGITSSIANGSRHYLFLVGASKENDKLRKENLELIIKTAALKEKEIELAQLKALLDLKKNIPEKTLPAQVIHFNPKPETGTLTINKGSSSGVTRFSGVISQFGFVGYVIEVFKNTSLVLLPTNRYTALEVICQRTRTKLLVQGHRKGLYAPYLQDNNSLQKGDLCVTSRSKKIFVPKGIPVGVISNIKSHNIESNHSVYLNPSVRSVTQVENVLVTLPTQKTK